MTTPRRALIFAAGGLVAIAVLVVALLLFVQRPAPTPRTTPNSREISEKANEVKPVEQKDQGVALVRQVIAKVKAHDLGVLDPELPQSMRRPRPLSREVLATLRLPGNRPLSPSLMEWLAFDASFLGWFVDLHHPALPEMNVSAGALAAFKDDSSGEAAYFNGLVKGALPGLCLPLLPGDQSRGLLYLSEPDALGEYPVLLIDIDDRPYVGVEYPGIDVYLATQAGILAPPREVTGSYKDDPRFRERMSHHIRSALGGRPYLELGDEGFPHDPAEVQLDEPPPVPEPGEPVPKGYRLYDGINPLTKRPMRFLMRKKYDDEK